MARLGRSFPGFSNNRGTGPITQVTITPVNPAAAPGVGAGVAATPTVTIFPNAAVGTGVGVTSASALNVFPAASVGAGVGVLPSVNDAGNPPASVGAGAGVGPNITINVSPAASVGSGLGANPTTTTGAGGAPNAGLGAGVGVLPTFTINVFPSAAPATGAGVHPAAGDGIAPAAAPGTGVGVNPALKITVFPLAAPGSGVGVKPTITFTAGGAPPAATGAGVGVNPTVATGAGPVPNPAMGAGVGVAPAISIFAFPNEADGTGVGTHPSVDLSAIAPLAAVGSGAATNPILRVTSPPLSAVGTGAGVNPTVTVGQGSVVVHPLAAQGVGVAEGVFTESTSGIAFDGLAIFETPQVRDRPPYLPDSSARQVGLMRHFENRLRGVLVWLRNDGTYCVDTPCNYELAMTQPAAYISDDPIGPDLTGEFQGLTDSNVNYPWNPFPGTTNSTIPGSYAYNVNWDQTTQDFILNPYLVQWWEGGAENVITQAQALQLTAAGFGDCISSITTVVGAGQSLGTYGSGFYGGGLYGEGGQVEAGAPVLVGAGIGSQPDGQGPYGSWAINA